MLMPESDAIYDQASLDREKFSRIERREWWLWATAILVTLLLTVGILSFTISVFHSTTEIDELLSQQLLRGLVGLVLLFDLYIIFQQLQIHRIRKQLLLREELFRLISENAADMIAVVDTNGNRIYNSPSYEKILGYSPEELKQTSSMEQIHPDDREKVRAAAAIAHQSGKGKRIEYRMRDKSGTWRFLESTASAVTNKQGKVEKLIIVNRDVSERQQLEKQFLQAQKMEAIGRLSGGIAHDFNNLLGVIIGYAEILEEDATNRDVVKESANQILKAGRQAVSLIKQLLAFSRQQILEPKIVDMNIVVRETEKMLRRLIGEDILLNTKLDDNLGRIKVDRTQLEQAIINMAVNARDAMPHGGDLTIETVNYEMNEQTVKQFHYSVNPGPYVRLSLSDTGTGMSAETLARVFEPFFSTKEKSKGTGLGLAMVYGFVKQSCGYIEINSELGLGTTVNIYLPCADEVSTAEKEIVIAPTAVAGNETILLVEDEPSLRRLTLRQLQSFGYKVLEAYDAASATAIGDAFKGNIHLLLTDVVLPQVNGQALASMLLEKRPSLRVLFISGYSGQILNKSGVLEEGCFFLPKPFTSESLAAKVREALSAHPKAG